jgi:hypothetical protein
MPLLRSQTIFPGKRPITVYEKLYPVNMSMEELEEKIESELFDKSCEEFADVYEKYLQNNELTIFGHLYNLIRINKNDGYLRHFSVRNCEDHFKIIHEFNYDFALFNLLITYSFMVGYNYTKENTGNIRNMMVTTFTDKGTPYPKKYKTDCNTVAESLRKNFNWSMSISDRNNEHYQSWLSWYKESISQYQITKILLDDEDSDFIF